MFVNNYRAWSLLLVVQRKNRPQKVETLTLKQRELYSLRNTMTIILKLYYKAIIIVVCIYYLQTLRGYCSYGSWDLDSSLSWLQRHSSSTNFLPKFSSLCKCLSYSSAISSKYQLWVWYLVLKDSPVSWDL